MKPFEKTFIAHRGLFDMIGNSISYHTKTLREDAHLADMKIVAGGHRSGAKESQATLCSDMIGNIPENSLAAFERAVECGYGIELDVQLTRDGELVVFHDDKLKRMCGIDRRLQDCTYKELQEYRLMGTEYTIPLFSEVLDIVSPNTPMIIEIKPHGRVIAAAAKLWEYLRDYYGIYCIESFNPIVLFWLRIKHREILRGQLSSDYMKEKSNMNIFLKILLSNLFVNALSAPDFIAYNFKYANQISYRICRKLYQPVNVAWTVRSKEELEEAEKIFQVIIFDSFLPEE
jgi:glycerophosphoryl diester phosphodiesterase